MTHAELLRKHATDATNEGGMWFSGEYLSRIAETAESLEDENAKLRELVKALLTCATDGDCDECRLNGATPWHVGKAQLCDGVWDRVRELGVEVDG